MGERPAADLTASPLDRRFDGWVQERRGSCRRPAPSATRRPSNRRRRLRALRRPGHHDGRRSRQRPRSRPGDRADPRRRRSPLPRQLRVARAAEGGRSGAVARAAFTDAIRRPHAANGGCGSPPWPERRRVIAHHTRASSVHPRSRSTAKVCARRSSIPNRRRSGAASPRRAPTAPRSSGRPRTGRRASTFHRCHAASAVNHGSRESAMYVHPASQVEDGSARNTRATGRREKGRSAAGTPSRRATRRVRRRRAPRPTDPTGDQRLGPRARIATTGARDAAMPKMRGGVTETGTARPGQVP
jgi:hypothetical protein